VLGYLSSGGAHLSSPIESQLIGPTLHAEVAQFDDRPLVERPIPVVGHTHWFRQRRLTRCRRLRLSV
jgi:hypothetical protein